MPRRLPSMSELAGVPLLSVDEALAVAPRAAAATLPPRAEGGRGSDE